ncbi:MAG: hypothetical protein IJL05_00950 [Alphaproteobacteria bacterium]|nr:hypothetical protein [Alphaproteobacteria bacterium]
MENANIIDLLKNSGLNEVSIENGFVLFQDPTCILPAFDVVLHYAWIIVLILIGIMLFGWGVIYIRNGVKLDSLFGNAKSLLLILTVFALVKPIVNVVYGDNLFAKQCDIKKVSLDTAQDLLKQREKQFENNTVYMQQETFDVIDSGVIDENQQDIVFVMPQTENYISGVSNIQSVQYTQRETIYISQDGTKIVRSGGSVAWRNNNPGNIRKSDFAMANGAIGVTDKWAVFPDERTGLNAVKKLLRSKNYNNLTVSAAIYRWAPASDNNNPEQYSKHISNMTGLPSDAVINNLSDDDLEHIARAIQSFEGWTPGKEQRL